MPKFTSEDELYRYVGGIFETGFGDPDLGPRMAATQLVLQLKCTEPDSSLIIDMSSRKVYQGTDGPTPDTVLLMPTEMSNAHWQGKLNLPVAIALGKVKVKGNAAALFALAPLGEKLIPRYLESLKADGRDDLLI